MEAVGVKKAHRPKGEDGRWQSREGFAAWHASASGSYAPELLGPKGHDGARFSNVPVALVGAAR